MKTRIPPPVILLIFGVAMWGVSRDATIYLFTLPQPLLISVLVATLGFAVATAGLRQFSRAQTTVNPHKVADASALVTDGIYRHTRNPMYVGLFLVLLAWTLWLGVIANVVLLMLFVVAINELQIKPEETALTALFGDEYRAYCSRVRRWV
ncbi:MAG: isoprenylcysteine carboxylmethyltransferase family protein [Pseudomonadota bacterium]